MAYELLEDWFWFKLIVVNDIMLVMAYFIFIIYVFILLTLSISCILETEFLWFCIYMENIAFIMCCKLKLKAGMGCNLYELFIIGGLL